MGLAKSTGKLIHQWAESTVNTTALALLWWGPAGVYQQTLENILESRVLPY